MSSSPLPNGHPLYRISYSAKVQTDISGCQRQAAREGRGDQFIAALRKIVDRLQTKPSVFGEPLYRLPTMKLQLRCAAISPAFVHFAVSEVRRVVYLRSVQLLGSAAGPRET